MAKIAVDGTPISLHGKGISRFLTSLLDAAARYGQKHEFIVYLNANTPWPDLPAAPHIHYVPVPIKNALIWDLFQFALLLYRNRVDLVFSCSDRLPLLYRGKIVLYLFELPGIRHRMKWRHASTYARVSMRMTDLLFPLSVRRASRIITSSKATRSDLCNIMGVDASRVEVIYPGRDETFTPGIDQDMLNRTRERLQSPNGYILHFSSIQDPRDNTEVALRSFHASNVFSTHGLKLVIAGKTDPVAQRLDTVIRDLGIEDSVVWAGYIPQDQLVDTYRSAALYLDPSLYEGFGYQALEAISCGVPVVCSNVSSLPEIVGDAAITCDPTDISAFATAIVSLLQAPQKLAQMSQKGIEQAQTFSWETAFGAMTELFERLTCAQPS
ncbi:MAG: glycosyltransferase family 4 protein [Candidatus Flexifilum sp.]